MGIFNKLQKLKGGYIFLSHSHADIEQVRKIRNQLEEDGFEPLCFYLKCLDDDSEIEELIKREIDAREWFLFVDSENSRKSKWVTLEREYIQKNNRKKILRIDVNNPQSVRNAIEKLLRHLRIYLINSGIDRQVAERIKSKLQEKDYLVFTAADNPVKHTVFWRRWNQRVITEASKEGCVIALLSQTSVQSIIIKYLIRYTIRKKGNVIPVILGDVQMDADYSNLLTSRRAYFLSQDPTDDEIDEMIDRIGRSIIRPV